MFFLSWHISFNLDIRTEETYHLSALNVSGNSDLDVQFNTLITIPISLTLHCSFIYLFEAQEVFQEHPHLRY